MTASESIPQESMEKTGYSPVPRRRRGNRRATGGSPIGGKEPRLAGIEAPARQLAPEDDALATWLKEQRPPHYE